MRDTHILVITYWKYEDALIQTYTLPYLKIIASILSDKSKIYLFTLDDCIKKTNEVAPKITNVSKAYYSFGFKSTIEWIKNFIYLYKLIKREKIEYIHCWCTPAGVAGYILSVLTGVKLIIDSYEPHAESMLENGTWKKNSVAFKSLFWFEKLQSKRANYLIAATNGMKDYAFEKYNVIKNNFFVKPACVDLNLFSITNRKNENLVSELGLTNKIVCVYAGKFGGIYLDKEVFDFFRQCELHWGEKFHALILSSHHYEEIKMFAQRSELSLSSITLKFVNHSQIPNYMGVGDFGITPVKSVPSKKYCTPIKNGEYWALGLPVVITKNISDDAQIIAENKIGSVLLELNTEGYIQSIKEIDDLLQNKSLAELYHIIRPIAEKYRNFNISNAIYNAIYNGL